MSGDAREAWTELTRLVLEGTMESSSEAMRDQVTDRVLRIVGAVADAVLPSGGAWDDAASARVAGLLRTRVVVTPDLRPALPSVHDVAIKCARLAHALTSGSTWRVEDALFVLRHLPDLADDVDDDLVPEGLPPPPPDGIVPFVVPHPQVGSRGRRSLCLARGAVAVPEVSASDAPVVCRLRSCEGTWVDVRSHEGAFLRPVMSPGLWSPVDLGTFAEAAADGRPWVDSPFLPPAAPGQSLHDLADLASPPDPSDADHAHRAADALAAAHARAGRLVSVDGTVYRESPEPVIRIVREWPWRRCDGSRVRHDLDGAWYAAERGPLAHPAADLRPGWSCGTLDAYASQDTWRPWWRHVIPGRGPDGWGAWSFAMGDHVEAEAFVRALAERGGSPVAPVPWQVLAPWAFRPTADPLRAALLHAVELDVLPCGSPADTIDALLAGRGAELLRTRWGVDGPGALDDAYLADVTALAAASHALCPGRARHEVHDEFAGLVL